MRVVSNPGAFATLNQRFTWVLEWRPRQGVVPGTQVELRSLNTRTFYEWTYVGIEVDGADITFRRRQQITPSDLASVRGKWTLARMRLPYGLRENEALRIRLTAVPPCLAGLFDAVSLWLADPPPVRSGDNVQSEFVRDLEAQALLEVGAGPVERFAVYSHPMPGPDGLVRTVVAPEDRFGNVARFRNTISVELAWNGKKWIEQIKGSRIISLPAPRDIGRLSVSIPLQDLASDENVRNGRRETGRQVVTGNPVWASAPGGGHAAFGEFHWHTEESGDGAGSLESGLLSARDHLNLDYATPSDHKPTADRWRRAVPILERFNKADEFVTFFGYEYGSSRGHQNYYFANPEHPISPVGGVALGTSIADATAQLLKYSGAEPFLAIPHHTNAESETRRVSDDTPYWFPYPWTKPAFFHRNVEIMQVRGNQERDEYPSDAWRGWYSNKASAQVALAHGYKVGFTGGTDNHCSAPGRALETRETQARMPPNTIILTGLWSERLQRDRVFDALYLRHTWAVWDTRAIVYFAVNGAQSGDEIEVPHRTKLTARIRISAQDALQSVEIVSETKTVWRGASEHMDFDTQASLGLCERSTHFYLRAMQRDGGIIYASPVFVVVGSV